MKRITQYFQPTSLTWWAGVFALALAFAQIMWPESARVEGIGNILAQLTGNGDASPAGLITMGLGLIGIRRKLTAIAEASARDEWSR